VIEDHLFGIESDQHCLNGNGEQYQYSIINQRMLCVRSIIYLDVSDLPLVSL